MAKMRRSPPRHLGGYLVHLDLGGPEFFLLRLNFFENVSKSMLTLKVLRFLQRAKLEPEQVGGSTHNLRGLITIKSLRRLFVAGLKAGYGQSLVLNLEYGEDHLADEIRAPTSSDCGV